MIEIMFLVIGLLSSAYAKSPIWNENGTCGRSKYPDAGDYFLPAPTIVGGIEARPNEFPWQIGLQTNTGINFCGGSIINDRWILTAAHCLQRRTPTDTVVVVGLHKKMTGANATSVKSHEIERLIMHKKYDPVTIANDIGLIKVKGSIRLDENVNTICAPESGEQYAHLKTVVSGWGHLASGSSIDVDGLRYTTLNTTTNAYCSKVHSGYLPAKLNITADMICASDNLGSTVRSPCQMDSGGPLALKEKDGTFRLVGVVSWAVGCASKYPAVFARVNYFEDWILKNIHT